MKRWKKSNKPEETYLVPSEFAVSIGAIAYSNLSGQDVEKVKEVLLDEENCYFSNYVGQPLPKVSQSIIRIILDAITAKVKTVEVVQIELLLPRDNLQELTIRIILGDRQKTYEHN